MRFHVIASLIVSSFAAAIFASPTIVLTSAILPGAVGDVQMDFTQNVVLDASTTQPRFGNVALIIRVDTHFVDMQFNNDAGTVLMSSITSHYNLADNSVLYPAPPYGLSAAGSIDPVDNLPGVYDVFFALLHSSATYFSPSSNLFVSQNMLPVQLIVHTNAIAALPGQTYSFEPNVTHNSVVLIGNGNAMRQTVNANVSGGVFTVVPEPSSVITVITGMLGVFAIKKRKS